MKLDDLIKHYENLAKDSADVNTGYIINNLKEFRILNKPHVDQFIADWYFGFNQESSTAHLYHTKEDLVNAGFEWMFNCPGIKIEEVEE